MTTSRQEQRDVVIPLGEGGVLEGLFVAGTDGGFAGAVIAPPHPQYGGSIHSPVVNEIAWACQKAGIASLCFNWRGIGGSVGEISGDPDAASEDYGAALAQLGDSVTGPLTASGYSFGAATALRCAKSSPRITRLLLVAPPPAMMELADLEKFPGVVLMIAGENDEFAPAAELTAIVASLERCELAVVPEADHFFASGLAEIGQSASRWLDKTVS